MSSIRSLPDDLIAEILDYLPTKSLVGCEQVCQQWRQLIKSRLWTSLRGNKSPPKIPQLT